MISYILHVMVAILFSLGITAFFYYNGSRLSKSSRVLKTIILVIVCSLALDVLSIMFYLFGSPDSSYFSAKPYAILVALPFFFASTSYWSDVASREQNKRYYFSIQAIGLLIGFILGFVLGYTPWGHTSIANFLNHATIWDAINYVMRP